MNLKGKNLEKISESKKEKMQQTLNRMNKTRQENIAKNFITAKLTELISELTKGKELITDHLKRVEDLKIQTYRIEGAITVLKELNDILQEKEATGK